MPFDSISTGALPVSTEPRRLPASSIDYDHYRQKAAAIRAEVYAEALKRLGLLAFWPLRRASEGLPPAPPVRLPAPAVR